MRDKLRRRYQVQKELTRNGYFEGEIAVSGLARLSELLYPDSSANRQERVWIRFEFVRNEYDIPMITGQLRTGLVLACQRCLQPLALPLEMDFRLLIDASDEVVRSGSLDSIDSDDGCIDINEVIEDELILAIPLVALHEDASCNEYWQASALTADADGRDNPFAVLEQLKTTD